VVCSARESFIVAQEITCRNSGAISNVVDARHGAKVLALWVRQQGELAASEALTKGTTLDFSVLLPNSPCCLTELNHINEA